MSFLFTTGIENSSPTLPTGERVDQMEASGHTVRWKDDFALVDEMGLDALRYGPHYFQVHTGPGQYDWSVCDEQMLTLAESNFTLIADLCHFGVPGWIGNFQNRDFPRYFAEYARAFALRYPWVRYYTPVNEMFICATFSARYGWWNECLQSDEAYMRALVNLAWAHELAVEAILEVRPDAIFIQSESFEKFWASGNGGTARAEELNSYRFVSLDLTVGASLGQELSQWLLERLDGVGALGDVEKFLGRRGVAQRLVGIDFYPTCLHRVRANGTMSCARVEGGFQALVREYHARFPVPFFHCETNRVSGRARGWLREQYADVRALRESGIPIHGFTWYSLTDQIDWQHALREKRGDVHAVGLFDLERRERGVGREFREIMRSERSGSGDEQYHLGEREGDKIPRV